MSESSFISAVSCSRNLAETLMCWAALPPPPVEADPMPGRVMWQAAERTAGRDAAVDGECSKSARTKGSEEEASISVRSL